MIQTNSIGYIIKKTIFVFTLKYKLQRTQHLQSTEEERTQSSRRALQGCAQNQMFHQKRSLLSTLYPQKPQELRLCLSVLQKFACCPGPAAPRGAHPDRGAAASPPAHRTFRQNLISGVPPIFFSSRWCHCGASWDPCSPHLCKRAPPPSLPTPTSSSQNALNVNPGGSNAVRLKLSCWETLILESLNSTGCWGVQLGEDAGPALQKTQDRC